MKGKKLNYKIMVSKIKTKKFNFRLPWWGIVLAILFVVFIYAYFVEPFWIKTKEFNLDGKGIQEKIVFVSDTHFGNHYGAKDLEKLVKRINEQNPDMVILGGDYVDRAPKIVNQYFEIIADVQAPDGVYGVLGNHDSNRRLISLVKEGMAKDGIFSLDNQGYWIQKGDKRIRVAGVGDYNYGTQDIDSAYGSDIKPSDLVILVAHNPDYFEELQNKRADLSLAGHMHGGQIGFGFWYPLLPSNYGDKYLGGLIRNGDKSIIVSKGIGMSIFPFRFGARPDIVVVNFQ